MGSSELTERLMGKLTSLKLLDNLEDHVQKSIGIIIEETIDFNIANVIPREINLQPIIKYDRCELHVKGGPENGKKSKYKYHMMSVGDVLIVNEDIAVTVNVGLRDYIKKHNPNWVFSKTKEKGEVKFKRMQ